MATILRIYDKFEIAERGNVYSIKNETYPSSFKLGDVFFDLTGNRFKVTGIEMYRCSTSGEISPDKSGIMLENIDNAEMQGQLLISEPPQIHFLFCNHPLYSRKVDEDYKEEFDICSQHFSTMLFSYEDLEQNQLSLYGDKFEGIAIYRGWMMKPELYALFYEKLKEQNIILINSPKEYNHYHLLPHWYPEFEEDTAKSAWTDTPDVNAALSLLHSFDGSVMIKDYVKSRKHEWYDACFIPDVTDMENANTVISNFVLRQAENIVGGIVIREFLNLNSIGYHTISAMPISEEYRAFVLAGNILAIDNYWNENEANALTFSQADLDWLTARIKKIHSNFVTMDFARKSDGSLVIMELGDGQVSGLQQISPAKFYSEI